MEGSASRDDEGEAFADYVRVLTAWRRLPYLDPGLAPELLPRKWSGATAADLFFALQRRLEAPAHRFVEAVRTSGPSITPLGVLPMARRDTPTRRAGARGGDEGSGDAEEALGAGRV